MHRIEAMFDGCCEPKNPGGHAAWGAVVKVDGETVYAAGGYCGHGSQMSNNVAEYTGALNALMECEKYDGVILLRGDSKLVIMQLQGLWKVNGGLYFPFYKQASEVYQRLRSRIRLEWVPRDKNEECDVLSKKQLLDRGVIFKIQPMKPTTQGSPGRRKPRRERTLSDLLARSTTVNDEGIGDLDRRKSL
jgi:ribonuclease HI